MTNHMKVRLSNRYTRSNSNVVSLKNIQHVAYIWSKGTADPCRMLTAGAVRAAQPSPAKVRRNMRFS